MMTIVYQDDRLVAVHKPAGVLVHRSPIDRNETRFLLQMLRDRLGRRVYPVHRLDKPTSGLVLFALDQEAARSVSSAFGDRLVSKTYLAVVRGVLQGDGVIDHPLAEEPDRYDRAGATSLVPVPAVTRFRAVGTAVVPEPVGRYPEARYSLVEVMPVTGRRRQIRRHLKHLSHPVIGDTTYGDGRHNRLFRDRFSCSRLLLAAVELTLPHPDSGEPVIMSAPLEDNFAAVVRALGWTDVAQQWLPRDFIPLQD